MEYFTLKGKDVRRLLMSLAFSVALVLGSFGVVIAADQEMDNAQDAVEDGEMANGEDINNLVDDASDFLLILLNANEGDQITNIVSNFDGTLVIADTQATAGNTLAATGFFDIATSTTFTVFMGNDDADSGGNTAAETSTLTVAGATGDNSSGSMVRGGTLALQGATDVTGDFDGVVTLAGAVTLSAATVQGGTGGTNHGAGMTLNLGDASGDAIDITTLTATGGTGAADPGGLATITVTGTLADATGGIDINGGVAAADNGGAATVTIAENLAALSGAVTVDGGSGSAAGVGGAAVFDTNGTVASSSDWTFTGGAGSSGGTGNGGAASIDAEGAITSTGRISFVGGAGGAGGTGAAGGASSGALNNTATTFAGITITGGKGAATNVGVGGNAALADVGALTSTDTILVTGGEGGTAAGASTGGTATLTAGSTSVLTGNVTVTGGAGNSNDAADGGAATATFTDDVTATNQTLTIVGGAGHASSNGDGGAAKVEFIASGTFSTTTGVVLDDGAAGNATAGGAVLEFDAAAAETFTGTITAQADGEGTINVQNSNGTGLTIASQIGTTSVRVATLNVLDGAATTGVFSSDVFVDDINVDSTNAASTADFNGDVSATTIDVGDGASGNIATAKFNADVTAAINLTDASGGDDALLVFDAASAQTVTGIIDGAATNSGNIQVSNNTGDGVTFKSNITDTHNIILDASTVSTYEGTVGTNDINAADLVNVTLHKAVVAVGTITLTNSTNSTITIGAGQTYGSASSASTDMITAADVVVTNTTGTQDINVYLPSDFQSGHLVLFQDSDSTGISAGELAAVMPQDTALIDYAAVDGGAAYSGTTSGETVVITATRKSASAAAAELGVTDEAANAIYNAATALTGGDATMAAGLTAALKAGGATATEAAEQVQGSPDGLSASSGAAVASTGGAVVSVGSSRMAALRTGNAYASTQGAGFNAGSLNQSNSMWMKPFASFGLQSERKGIAGYDADTYGIAIGADTRLNAKSVVGLSFSYADTDVDGKGAGRSRTDISSYQLTAYGDYTAKDWYVEALVGYAYNEIDSTRNVTFANATATGDTESNQFMFSVNAGMPIQVESNSYFTPTTGLSFTHVTNQDYTETGAGGLNLRVNAEDITIAKLHVGGRYHANIATTNGRFTPEVRAKLLYDLAGDDGSSTNTFTGGGAAFDVKGLDVVEFATAVGAGIAYTPSFDEGMSLSLNYDAEIKENFTGHSANFTLKYAF